MKKNMKKISMVLAILLVSLTMISCGNGNGKNGNNKEVQKEKTSEEKDQETKQEEAKTEEAKPSNDADVKINIEYGAGDDEEFTTDGKLHDEEFLNKEYSYTDTADSFKIEKDEKGYVITDYIDESVVLEKDVPVKEEKHRLKLYKDIYLVKEDGSMVYAYDTKLKTIVFLNSNFRIFMAAEKAE